MQPYELWTLRSNLPRRNPAHIDIIHGVDDLDGHRSGRVASGAGGGRGVTG